MALTPRDHANRYRGQLPIQPAMVRTLSEIKGPRMGKVTSQLRCPYVDPSSVSSNETRKSQKRPPMIKQRSEAHWCHMSLSIQELALLKTMMALVITRTSGKVRISSS